MGRYSDRVDGLIFFGIGIISASFHVDGKEPEAIEVLNIVVNMGVSKSRRGMIILRLMLSDP